MSGIMVCPRCSFEIDPSNADSACPSCGAARDSADDCTNVYTSSPQHPLETTIEFGAPGNGIAARSSSALRLQTLMSHAPIAAAVKRLREQMRNQPRGLKSIVDLVVLVALADNQIDEVELVALHEIINIVVGDVQTGLARHLINSCVGDIRANGLESCAQSVRDALVTGGAVEDGLIVAFAAAFSSDGLSIPERGAIQAVWEGTPVPYDRVTQLRDMVRAALDAVDARG